MTDSIYPSDDGRSIIMVEEGSITAEGVVGRIVAAHALGAELGIRCYLMDATAARNSDSALSNLKLAQEEIPHTVTIDRRACVAAAVDPLDDSHDFFEAAARGAGFDFTLFRDREAAVEHLLVASERLAPPSE